MKVIRNYIFILFALLFSTLQAQQVFEWAKSVGAGNMDIAQKVKLDDLGNVYSLGTFTGTVDFDPSPTATFNLDANPNHSSFLQKLDPNGNFLWALKIDGVNHAIITFDIDSSIYLVGHYNDSTDFDPSPNSDFFLVDTGIFVLKLNLQGDFLWVKNINATNFSGIGLDSSSNIYLSGGFMDSVDFDPSPNGSFILTTNIVNGPTTFFLKLDSNGNFQWVNKLNTGTIIINDLDVEPSGNILVTGVFNGAVDFDPSPVDSTVLSTSIGATYNCFTLKLDKDGIFNWVNQISTFSYGNDLCFDLFGNVIITGFFKDSADFDPSLISSYFLSSAVGSNDIFVQKLDSSGNFIWAKRVGSTGFDEGWAVTTDLIGDVYVGGVFGYNVDFNPSPIDSAVVAGNPNGANGAIDAFILKLDVFGNFSWVHAVGGNGSAAITSLAVDSNVNLFSTGYFGGNSTGVGNANFDENSSNYSLNSNGNFDAFVMRLSQPLIVGIPLDSKCFFNTYVFPNPTSGKVYIKGVYREKVITIASVLGEVVCFSELESDNTIDLSNLGPGVYVVSNGEFVARVVRSE